MRKVNLEVLKPWIGTRITELLGGVEDEVLIGARFLSRAVAAHPAARTQGAPRRSGDIRLTHRTRRAAGMVINLLSEAPSPSGRDMFAGLLSFLEKNTSLFMKELWGHLASAMANSSAAVPQGIAQFLLDAKREEL